MFAKTYVYNDTEVKLTQRIAERTVRKKTQTLYEIQPANPENGSWRKWVMLQELFEIKNNKNVEN